MIGYINRPMICTIPHYNYCLQYDRLHKPSNDLYDTTLQLLSTNYNSIPSNAAIRNSTRKQYAKSGDPIAVGANTDDIITVIGKKMGNKRRNVLESTFQKKKQRKNTMNAL